MQSHKYFAIVLSHTLTLFFLCSYTRCAAESESSSNNQRLNGSVQDKEKMEASVKLLLAPPPAPKPSAPVKQPPLKSNVEQLSGSTTYSPRTSAPAIPMIVPHANVPNIMQPKSRLNFTPVIPRPFSRFTSVETIRPNPSRWLYPTTPRNGIMIWSPEYATKHVKQPNSFSKNTSLRFSASTSSGFLNEHQARASILNYATPAPAQIELQAVQQVLPAKHDPPPANWNLWYEQVAKAVYAQWTQNTSLGAGKALVQLTVYASRNVTVKVIDFAEAPGAEQNIPAETKFREASLKAINVLDGADVWAFPPSAGNLKQVTFDMELNHAVGEAPGCSVVRMHTD